MKNEMDLYSDLQKVEHLFKKYYKILLAYAFRFVNDKYQAENIVQDVFFELWSKHEELNFGPGIKSYLFKSVYNRCLNHLNNPSTLRNTSLDQVDNEEIFFEFFISQEKEPGYWLIMDELDREIKQLIEQLPPQCRKVFLLSRTKELKNKEIAEELGISIKAVEKQMSKAISFLRRELKEKGVFLLLYLFFQ